MKSKRRFYWILAAGLLAANVFPAYGATTQEQISEKQQEKQQTESSLESTQERIEELESQKGQSEAYLTELNRQLSDLTSNLQTLQQEYADKQEELTQVQNELEEAKAQEEEQYEAMKVRIQFMYEHSQTGALEMLFSADSFMDFLNRADNISEITKYDREMLANYEATRQEVAEKEQQVLTEQQAIEELQAQSVAQQDQIQELYEYTYGQIQAYADELAGAESEEAALLASIQTQEDALNQLLIQAKQEEVEAQRRAEEAARQAAEEAARQQASQNQQNNVNQAGTQNGAGTSDSTQSSGSGASGEESSSGGTYLGNFKLTAYCSCSICCGQWSQYQGLTASGAQAQAGVTVAMAGVPFGTKLLINGHVYTVQDRGTAYGHVDIYFDSHAEALAFGRQYADVYMVN